MNLLAPIDATMNWNWIFYSPPSLPPASHPGMNSITLTCALVLSIGVVFNLSLTVVLKYLASLWCTVLGVIEVVLQLGLIVVGGACLPNQGAPQRTAWRLPSICQELESAVPLSTCGDQEDGRWSMPGWRSLGEDGGGGFSTNLFTFSKGKVSSPKLSKLLILWFVFVSSA